MGVSGSMVSFCFVSGFNYMPKKQGLTYTSTACRLKASWGYTAADREV